MGSPDLDRAGNVPVARVRHQRRRLRAAWGPIG